MRTVFTLFLLIAVNLVHAQSDTLVIIERDTVYFDTAKSDIRDDQIPGLNRLIDISKKANVPKIQIIAHTDFQGSRTNNYKLSRSRSQSVKDYFIKNGIPDTLITYDYKGEDQPINQDKDPTSLQLNRRAEVFLFKNIPVVFLNGQITDETTNEPIKATIHMHSRFWNETIKTDSNGQFKLMAPRNAHFGLDVTAEGYLYSSKMLKASENLAKSSINIALQELAIGKSFDLEQLYFVGNKDIILEKSFQKLSTLLAFMNSNPSSCIEIKGHINLPRTPRTEYNTWSHDLSVARARRIFHFLISRGIHSDRMVFKGYGNWEMVYPDAVDEKEMALNRRVEIEIIDCQKATNEKNDSLSEASVFYILKEQLYH